MKEIYKLKDLPGTFLCYMQLDKGIWFSQNGENWVDAVSHIQQFYWNWDNIIFDRCLCVNDRGQAVFQGDTIDSRFGAGIVVDYCQTTGTLYFKVSGQLHHSHLAHVELTEQALLINE